MNDWKRMRTWSKPEMMKRVAQDCEPEKFLVAPVFSVHPTPQSIPVLEKAVGFGHRQWHGRGIQDFRR